MRALVRGCSGTVTELEGSAYPSVLDQAKENLRYFQAALHLGQAADQFGKDEKASNEVRFSIPLATLSEAVAQRLGKSAKLDPELFFYKVTRQHSTCIIEFAALFW